MLIRCSCVAPWRGVPVYATKPGSVWACRALWCVRGVLAWVKPSVFGFADAGAVTTAGVGFHLAGGFPASCVRFIGAEFGGVRVTVVEFASALDVVDDVEGPDRVVWRAGRAENGGDHLSPFPARAVRAAATVALVMI